MKSEQIERVNFPDWEYVLQVSELTKELKRSIKITILWYLGWCKKQRQAVNRSSAVAFLKIVRKERSPPPDIFENWRLNLLWFFDTAASASDVDRTLERTKVYTDWEREFVSKIRQQGKSYRTEQTYLSKCRQFLGFLGKTEIESLVISDIETYMTHISVDQKRSVATQRQALNAIVFLYRNLLRVDIPDELKFERAAAKGKLPVLRSKL